jgi:hypothetical protein
MRNNLIQKMRRSLDEGNFCFAKQFLQLSFNGDNTKIYMGIYNLENSEFIESRKWKTDISGLLINLQ